ncbi:hypothetical protein V8C44DRAFT_368416 [Trichoderma aethiopicum]
MAYYTSSQETIDQMVAQDANSAMADVRLEFPAFMDQNTNFSMPHDWNVDWDTFWTAYDNEVASQSLGSNPLAVNQDMAIVNNMIVNNGMTMSNIQMPAGYTIADTTVTNTTTNTSPVANVPINTSPVANVPINAFTAETDTSETVSSSSVSSPGLAYYRRTMSKRVTREVQRGRHKLVRLQRAEHSSIVE